MTREEITEVNKILDYAKKVNMVAYKVLKKALEQEPVNDFIQYAKELGEDIKVVKSDDPDTFEKIFGEKFCNDVESIRQELLERGDEMVSFRQLVKRFDEVEDEYKGVPWNLEQIYNNFNILIGEEPCEDAISRRDMALNIVSFYDKATGKEKTLDFLCKCVEGLPSVQLKPKTGHWIDTYEGLSPFKCSECELLEFKRSKYCPNCGAKME